MKQSPSNQTKTIQQWFETFQEPHRSQALANMWWEDKDTRYSCSHLALAQGFNWSRSPEGTTYWKEFHKQLQG